MSDQTAPPPATPPAATPPPEQPKRKKPTSRSARWADACGNALAACEALAGHLDDLENALSELRGVQEEYEEWKDNLPENLQSSPLGEKLEEVCGIDIEDAAQEVRDAVEECQGKIEEAEAVDLPRGFGRD